MEANIPLFRRRPHLYKVRIRVFHERPSRLPNLFVTQRDWGVRCLYKNTGVFRLNLTQMVSFRQDGDPQSIMGVKMLEFGLGVRAWARTDAGWPRPV